MPQRQKLLLKTVGKFYSMDLVAAGEVLSTTLKSLLLLWSVEGLLFGLQNDLLLQYCEWPLRHIQLQLII